MIGQICMCITFTNVHKHQGQHRCIQFRTYYYLCCLLCRVLHRVSTQRLSAMASHQMSINHFIHDMTQVALLTWRLPNNRYAPLQSQNTVSAYYCLLPLRGGIIHSLKYYTTLVNQATNFPNIKTA